MVYLPTFTHIYNENQPNVGKYTIPMYPMGFGITLDC